MSYSSCLRCWRKHPGDGPYCSGSCEEASQPTEATRQAITKGERFPRSRFANGEKVKEGA